MFFVTLPAPCTGVAPQLSLAQNSLKVEVNCISMIGTCTTFPHHLNEFLNNRQTFVCLELMCNEWMVFDQKVKVSIQLASFSNIHVSSGCVRGPTAKLRAHIYQCININCTLRSQQYRPGIDWFNLASNPNTRHTLPKHQWNPATCMP